MPRPFAAHIPLQARGPSPSLAWVVALLWGACGVSFGQTAPTTEPRLGYLLLSPVERQALDGLRALAARNAAFGADGTPMDSALPADSVAAPAPAPEVLQAVANPLLAIDGIVVRQGNKSTIWLNGEPLYGADAANALRKQATQAGVVRTAQGRLTLQGKPGEVWNTTTGERTDLLPRNAIRIQRQPAKQP